MQKPGSGGLVYSTDSGRMCPACRQPVAACVCGQAVAPVGGDGVLRVSRDKAGCSGKTVTMVRGAVLGPAELAALGKRLKAACGSGGTVKDGAVEIQGDHLDRLLAWLTQAGFNAKRTGG